MNTLTQIGLLMVAYITKSNLGLQMDVTNTSDTIYYQLNCTNGDVLAPGVGILGNHSPRLRNLTFSATGRSSFNVSLEQLRPELRCSPPTDCLRQLFMCTKAEAINNFCPNTSPSITNQRCGYVRSCGVGGISNNRCSESGCRLAINGSPGENQIVMLHVFELEWNQEQNHPGFYIKNTSSKQWEELAPEETRVVPSNVQLLLRHSGPETRTQILIGFEVFDGPSDTPDPSCWKHADCWSRRESPSSTHGCKEKTTLVPSHYPENNPKSIRGGSVINLTAGVIAGIVVAALITGLLLIVITCLVTRAMERRKKFTNTLDKKLMQHGNVYKNDQQPTQERDGQNTNPHQSTLRSPSHVQQSNPTETQTENESGQYEEIGTIQIRPMSYIPSKLHDVPLFKQKFKVDSLILEENDLYCDLQNEMCQGAGRCGDYESLVESEQELTVPRVQNNQYTNIQNDLSIDLHNNHSFTPQCARPGEELAEDCGGKQGMLMTEGEDRFPSAKAKEGPEVEHTSSTQPAGPGIFIVENEFYDSKGKL